MKKIYLAILGMAALTISNQVKAQKNFSLSVLGTPQFSFLQNEDDNNNSSFDRRSRFNTAFGVGGAYNFTGKTCIGLDVLYSLQGQRFDIN